MMSLRMLAGGLLAFAVANGTAQVSPVREITLSVDLTDAPRKIIHATETKNGSPANMDQPAQSMTWQG